MPRRQVDLVAGEFYHVYNRGNNKEKIFFERENYRFFLSRFRKYVLQPEEDNKTIDLIAYCLMPHHYHFLVKLLAKDFSKQMQSFAQSYGKSINKSYDRVGSLFQGRFRAIRIDRESYLLHLSRYIHLNPVEAKLAKKAEDWEFSSYRSYLGIESNSYVNTGVVLSQFSNQDGYRRFVESRNERDDSTISHLTID